MEFRAESSLSGFQPHITQRVINVFSNFFRETKREFSASSTSQLKFPFDEIIGYVVPNKGEFFVSEMKRNLAFVLSSRSDENGVEFGTAAEFHHELQPVSLKGRVEGAITGKILRDTPIGFLTQTFGSDKDMNNGGYSEIMKITPSKFALIAKENLLTLKASLVESGKSQEEMNSILEKASNDLFLQYSFSDRENNFKIWISNTAMDLQHDLIAICGNRVLCFNNTSLSGAELAQLGNWPKIKELVIKVADEYFTAIKSVNKPPMGLVSFTYDRFGNVTMTSKTVWA